jgi:hypothetical protein
MSSLNRIATEVKRGWSDSAPLTATTFVMLVAFVASVAGILLDGRLITGVPAWLKPAKFAILTAIFSGTMAWLYRYISVWQRFVRAMGVGTGSGSGLRGRDHSRASRSWHHQSF